MRLDKWLSDATSYTRSQLKQLIRSGQVTVNQTIVKKPETPVQETDVICLQGNPVEPAESCYCLLLNKPLGYVCAVTDATEKTVMELIPPELQRKGLFPVGRLDKDSEGLLLLTNDGSFANGIMHPSRHISKTYRVTVRPDVTEEQLIALSGSMELDGKMTQPATVVVKTKEPGRVVLLMTIHEGKNRQIRRMCESVGLEVARLRRISIGPLKLGMLKPGTYRDLTAEELRAIRNAMGTGETAAPAKNKGRRR